MRDARTKSAKFDARILPCILLFNEESKVDKVDFKIGTDLENALVQTVHLNGLSPVCIRKCLVNSS